MLARSFDRFYVVREFILPSIQDLKFSNISYDGTFTYLDERNSRDVETKKYILDLQTFCKKIEPYVNYYKKQIKSYNDTAHKILENEINSMLPQITSKRIITTLFSSFIGLAYEGISSFLHNKRCKALHKTVKAMDSKAKIQCNKLIQLEISMIIYSIYNAETLEQLTNTVQRNLNTTTSKNKCIILYKEFIKQLHIYAAAIRIPSKGYLPISLITPLELKEILKDVSDAIHKTNPDYNLVIK